MNPLSTLPHKTKYRGQWQHTSDHLHSQGCYEWMAEQLDELSPRKVLDIGCGSGNGLLALLSRFKPATLIALEENRDCIETTVEALVEADHNPLAYLRLTYELADANKYRVFCSDAPVEFERDISIVQTDVTRADSMLIEVLEKEAPFDAITVWLIGTDAHNLHSVGTTPPDYRWHIQRRLCQLAGRLLRPGGWIQFVDRTAFPITEDQQTDLVEDHKGLLESTGLEFRGFANLSYQEAGEGGVPMARASGKIGPDAAMGLKSLISWLPDTSPKTDPMLPTDGNQ